MRPTNRIDSKETVGLGDVHSQSKAYGNDSSPTTLHIGTEARKIIRRPQTDRRNRKPQYAGHHEAVGATKRSKFINLRPQFTKQQVKQHNFQITHVPSKLCTVDMFTKPLERRRFEDLRDMIDVRGI